MKSITTVLAGLVLSAVSAAAAADAPRLALWVTDSIGASSAIQCELTNAGAAVPLPATRPTLTERDVAGWSRDGARWRLASERFAAKDAAMLQDHCFILAIEGGVISTGVVLSSHSARLTGFATLNVTERNNALELQLTSSHHGSPMRLIHVDLLDAVFRR